MSTPLPVAPFRHRDEAPVTLLAIVYSDPVWETWPVTSASDRGWPAPGVSRTTTDTGAADDGVAACAAAGPTTPTPTAVAAATVSILRADWGSPPHVTPKENGDDPRSFWSTHIPVLLTVWHWCHA